MAAIESNFLISGNWAATGRPGLPDLSEGHLDWWNGFNTWFNADGDTAYPIGLTDGTGNFDIMTTYLSRGDGAIWELGAWSELEAPPQYDFDYEYFYVRDIIRYQLKPDLSNIDQIKQQIMTGGAVSTAICWSDDFLNGYDHYQPDTDFRVPNHTIAIVGWDDNRITAGTAPGAWLCKNSDGILWGDKGYFWVSYYDKHCCRNPEIGVYAYLGVDFLPHGSDYNYFYAHDYHGWRATKTDCSEAFNAFAAPRDQLLNSVSFYTATDSVSYAVRIYDRFAGGQLEGELRSAGGLVEHNGFHTVDLPTPLELSAGDDFYIYLSLSQSGQPYDHTSTVELVLGGAAPPSTVPSKAEPGQSYFYNGSEWQDLTTIDPTANFCIKGIAVELAPLPVAVVSVRDGGNGMSLMASFEPQDTAVIDHIIVCCEDTVGDLADTIIVPATSGQALFEGLTEGRLYRFHAVAEDKLGRQSLAFKYAYGTPHSLPAQPRKIEAFTLNHAIRVIWSEANTELDFDHYTLFRDGSALPQAIADTFFIDDDPAIGTDFHRYMVVAVDNDGNLSDTAYADTASMRAASLRPNEILAVNRSGSNPPAMVNEFVTGQFMREALADYSLTYISDTSASNPDRTGLMNMIDYGLIVIGAESARQDDIGSDPAFGGILDQIGYYVSIGGKAVIFGRWGNIALNDTTVDTAFYPPGGYSSGYSEYFDLAYRVIPCTYINANDTVLESDLIGAHGQSANYPDLAWDSAATADHSAPLSKVTGIPCPDFAVLSGTGHEILYTYNSANDSLLTEGQPVAWKGTCGDGQYVFFDLPLSFMERPEAVAVLQQAVGDMGIVLDVADHTGDAALPHEFELAQNYPNPFNPQTTIKFFNPQPRPVLTKIEIFNILGQRVATVYDAAAVPGWNRAEWDGHDSSGRPAASGVYFYRLKADGNSRTRKMLLLR